MTRVPLMTAVPVIVLLPPLLGLQACSLGGADDPVSAERTQRAVTTAAEDALPVAARVLGARKVEAHAEWSECLQGLAWEYKGGAAVTAPGGHAQVRLRAVQAALLDAGFTRSLTTDDQVSVERDGISLTIHRPTPNPSYPDAKHVWPVFIESGCHGYPDADQALIERDRGNDFPGLRP